MQWIYLLGKRCYEYEGKEVSGSSLIFLEEILSKKNKLKKNNIKIKLFFVEIIKKNFNELKGKISKFVEIHPEIEDIVEIHFYKNDCNKVIGDILKKIKKKEK